MADGSNHSGQILRDIDVMIPHSARIWNYWLGGKDNFRADREAGDEFLELYPAQLDKARACRRFLARAVQYLAADEGVRQFLDIGTGLPTANNTHEVAQPMAPESRIVYVDNDPLVLAHARALLTSSPEGVTGYIDADLHDPETILAAAAETLDFTRPIAMLLIGVLGHVEDYDEARSIVRRLLDALPSGSYLVQCDGTDDQCRVPRGHRPVQGQWWRPVQRPSQEQIAGFYEGLELIEPGVVPIPQWRAQTLLGEPRDVDESGGVGRKR